VVLDHRLEQERVEDRRRIGEPGRLDDDAPERRDLAAVPPPEQVAQLVGEIAAQRAADAAALRSTVRSSTRRSRWWSIATSPSSLTITAVSPIPG
jgi:hypothetical protein